MTDHDAPVTLTLTLGEVLDLATSACEAPLDDFDEVNRMEAVERHDYLRHAPAGVFTEVAGGGGTLFRFTSPLEAMLAVKVLRGCGHRAERLRDDAAPDLTGEHADVVVTSYWD